MDCGWVEGGAGKDQERIDVLCIKVFIPGSYLARTIKRRSSDYSMTDPPKRERLTTHDILSNASLKRTEISLDHCAA